MHVCQGLSTEPDLLLPWVEVIQACARVVALTRERTGKWDSVELADWWVLGSCGREGSVQVVTSGSLGPGSGFVTNYFGHITPPHGWISVLPWECENVRLTITHFSSSSELLFLYNSIARRFGIWKLGEYKRWPSSAFPSKEISLSL